FLLRKVFNENGDRRKWIETIPRRGYRFVGEVKALLPVTNTATIDSPLKPIGEQTLTQALTEADKDNAGNQDNATESFTETSQTLPAAERQSLLQSSKVRSIILTTILLLIPLTLIAYLIISRKPTPSNTLPRSTSGLIRLTNNPAADEMPRWSPDGSKIAFQSNRDGKYEIYVMDVDGANVKRLTNNQANDTDPAWSPDGKKIAFQSDR